MKWPFSRKKDVSSVPVEIQEYYQTERRERTGIAWLLALGTLLLTMGLAALLFFGGRWIYRAITDDDNNQETAQQEEKDEDEDSGETKSDSSSQQPSSSTGTSSTSTSTPNNSSSPTPSPAATGGSTQGATTTPATGDLPNTGAGDIVAIFIATAAVASIGHYTLTRRVE